jgi:hypothetical protein
MEKKFKIYLDTITYGGENIGNDLTFTIMAAGGQATTVKQTLSNGKSTAALNKTILKADTKDDPKKVKIDVSIVEKDKISDSGSGSGEVSLDMKKDGPQAMTMDVEVKGVGGDKGKTGKFTLKFVGEVLKPVRVKGKVTVKADAKATADKGVSDGGDAPKDRTVAAELAHFKRYNGENVFTAEYEIVSLDGELDLMLSKVVLKTITYLGDGNPVRSNFTTPPQGITKVKFVGGDPTKVESFSFGSNDWYDPTDGSNNRVKDRVMTGSMNLVKGEAEYEGKYTLRNNGVIGIYTLKGKIEKENPGAPVLPPNFGNPEVFTPKP